MFDADNLLPDLALRRPVDFDVAAFLERIHSPMATLLVQDGSGPVLASRVLEDAARNEALDVRVLLVRLQMEQSLLTRQPTPERLDWAMGYGATDSGLEERYRGFATQVRAAARTLTGYLRADHPLTVVGLVGTPMHVSDGTVTPRTLATAALYRYTPWIGRSRVGNLSPPFGNFLFYTVWVELFGEEPQNAALGDERPWRAIVPRDNWRNALPLSQGCYETLSEVASRLRLVQTVDAEGRKLYLDVPRAPESPPSAPPPPTQGSVRFPSTSLPKVAASSLGALADLYRPARPSKAAPLLAADPQARLSPHFLLGEFLPRDPSYRYARVSPKLVEFLERFREALGGHPLRITSGYRPPAYNAAVGGAADSLHLDGLAADVVSEHVPFAVLAETADRLIGEAGGVGTYWGQSFVHVDLRGEYARWP